ncbi:MAG TPA: acetyl-CoA carboxylase carboxyl transferase subunit beta [Ruminococcaceae bacterium]|jgi:acetyl-CoA carboxylase carboxyl transferase subunit beta|nr:acetyl-CoA carboxylase carboxyl transferase subunit beta [Oscillospiraceae bacterium]
MNQPLYPFNKSKKFPFRGLRGAESQEEREKKEGRHRMLSEASPVVTCPSCKKTMVKSRLAQSLFVCPTCGHHFPISAYERLNFLLDRGSLLELEQNNFSEDPLNFPGYREKLESERKKSGLPEAVVTATGRIDGRKAVFSVLDGRFLMGSMGAAVGEAITCAVEYAQKERLPLVIFSASGGARMQEGIISLMQMAKTSAAIARFSEQGGLYISYLTHPTTGGVSASFAGLGDITLAEPGALIGFAGPRVIEQTIRQKLPEGFQRAEYLEEHGFVDRIVPRGEMRAVLSLLLRLHEKGGNAAC